MICILYRHTVNAIFVLFLASQSFKFNFFKSEMNHLFSFLLGTVKCRQAEMVGEHLPEQIYDAFYCNPQCDLLQFCEYMVIQFRHL